MRTALYINAGRCQLSVHAMLKSCALAESGFGSDLVRHTLFDYIEGSVIGVHCERFSVCTWLVIPDIRGHPRLHNGFACMSAALVVHSARTFARASRTSFPIALRALRSTAYLYTMKQPSLPVFHIDAFSAAPFGGNPAAVCLLTSALPDSVRQKIAQELNLSETAFVEPLTTSTSGDANDLQRSFAEDDSFRLRYDFFTI